MLTDDYIKIIPSDIVIISNWLKYTGIQYGWEIFKVEDDHTTRWINCKSNYPLYLDINEDEHNIYVYKQIEEALYQVSRVLNISKYEAYHLIILHNIQLEDVEIHEETLSFKWKSLEDSGEYIVNKKSNKLYSPDKTLDNRFKRYLRELIDQFIECIDIYEN